MGKFHDFMRMAVVSLGMCMVFFGYGYEPKVHEIEGLDFIVIQSEENPMWMELVASPDYKNLNDVIIREGYELEGYSFLTNSPRPAIVEKIGDRAFYATILTNIELPSSIRRIGKSAFQGSHLAQAKLSVGLFSIGEKAFANTRLKKIILPESVRFMEYGCFSNCYDLTEIDLPSTLITLGGFSFRYSYSLQDIYCRAMVPPMAEESDFGRVYNEDYPMIDLAPGPNFSRCVLHVPSESIELYRNAPGWSLFRNIVPIEATSAEEIAILDDRDIDLSASLEVYDLSGVKVGTATEGLPKGIYILKQGAKRVKIAK